MQSTKNEGEKHESGRQIEQIVNTKTHKNRKMQYPSFHPETKYRDTRQMHGRPFRLDQSGSLLIYPHTNIIVFRGLGFDNWGYLFYLSQSLEKQHAGSLHLIHDAMARGHTTGQ